MADLLENLNERQREAVLETEGYVRVIAGAGSGKTKLLVSRYAYLVQDYGIDSANILCVTFTNKAAGEMKKRIRGLIGAENDTGLICTYHGFCNRLLRENPEKLFLNKQFQIIDNSQQKAILGDIYQKFELKLDYASFESILRKIGVVKRDGAYVTRMCNPEPCQILNEIKSRDDRIIEEFLQRQKAAYLLDFHDLISFAIHVLETFDDIREKWQDRLNYIMVDEFQDSSSVEMRLVDILSEKYRNMMIVGDPDQNIYEWRGSDVSLLVDFDKAHEPTKTIILNQNYRSTPQILQCANALIEKNELRLKKDLFTKNPAGSSVVHYHSRNDLEEMDHVIEQIKRLSIKEGFRYSDFAILYRSSFLSRIAEKKLVEKNIPYEIFGGVRFYQRMEILDILAYLKLIAYDDDASFRRVINTPRRRFGRAKLNFLEELKERGPLQQESMMQGDLFDFFPGTGIGEGVGTGLNGADGEAADGFGMGGVRADGAAVKEAAVGGSLFAVLSAHLDAREFADSDAGSFVRFINHMRAGYKKKRISDIVNEVTKDSGYESYIRELGDEERLNNLAEFKRIANEFEREFGENMSLEGFLQQIALQSGEDGGDGKDAVKLMTIHSSKGLEFPVVFILGFTEGVFPSAKTLEERKKLGLEEERRLCYVAITRAEKHLFLMDSEGTSDNGIKKMISRFLEEIGEKNYVRIGRISEELRKESRQYTAKLNREMQSETGTAKVERKIGDGVEHHVFGRGIIQAIDKKRRSYLVKFEKLEQPRNISESYFDKKHEDVRRKANESERLRNLPEEMSQFNNINNQGAHKESLKETSVEMKQEEELLTADAVETDAPSTVMPEELREEQLSIWTLEKFGEVPPDGLKFKEPDHEEAEPEEPKLAEPERPKKNGMDEPEEEDPDKYGRDEPEEEDPKKNGRDEPEEEDPEKNGRDEPEEEDPEKYEREESEDYEPEQEQAEQIDSPVISGNEKNQAAHLKKLKENSPNLWKREEVPHMGWKCVGVEDLGAPVGICEMCGYQIIRYAHQMEHPLYRSLSVGCVCAGKMEGDIAEAKQREAEFKKKQARRISFFQRKWNRSKKGNEYLKIDGHVIVLYNLEKAKHIWKYAVDNQFCKDTYASRERALAGVFDALERLRK